jgi:hypothetical protein
LEFAPSTISPSRRRSLAAENRIALISLLNAILQPKSPIVEVTLENPFNLQDDDH